MGGGGERGDRQCNVYVKDWQSAHCHVTLMDNDAGISVTSPVTSMAGDGMWWNTHFYNDTFAAGTGMSQLT